MAGSMPPKVPEAAPLVVVFLRSTPPWGPLWFPLEFHSGMFDAVSTALDLPVAGFGAVQWLMAVTMIRSVRRAFRGRPGRATRKERNCNQGVGELREWPSFFSED
jgi:hypothetical protein